MRRASGRLRSKTVVCMGSCSHELSTWTILGRPRQPRPRLATVPQTDPAEQPFAAWQRSALVLAQSLDASVVDDNGQPLSEPGFTAIGGELERLYVALAARDLPAGSMAARRLFS